MKIGVEKVCDREIEGKFDIATEIGFYKNSTEELQEKVEVMKRQIEELTEENKKLMDQIMEHGESFYKVKVEDRMVYLDGKLVKGLTGYKLETSEALEPMILSLKLHVE